MAQTRGRRDETRPREAFLKTTLVGAEIAQADELREPDAAPSGEKVLAPLLHGESGWSPPPHEKIAPGAAGEVPLWLDERARDVGDPRREATAFDDRILEADHVPARVLPRRARLVGRRATRPVVVARENMNAGAIDADRLESARGAEE